MTMKELSQLYHLRREIEMDRKRLKELKALRTSEDENLYNQIKMTSDIEDLERIIHAKMELCICERVRLERYIAGVDDSFMRQVLTYRYTEGLAWGKIARRVGGNNSSDSCRKAVCRWLAKE